MSKDRTATRLVCAAGVLVFGALVLSGCSSTIADMQSLTPNDAPARPKEVSAYLPVNDLPRDRDEATMSPDQRAKLQKELLAARDRQASAGTANTSGK